MSEKIKKSIAVQGSILAIAGIITKIIGFLYRIPMANIMGNTGNCLYSAAFGIYNIALTLSSYSMPMAVSKLISERITQKRYKDANKLFSRALIFAFIMGTIACSVLFFGADFLAGLYKREGLERPLRVLAPTTFIVALLGTMRGFYQGHKNMVPTAVSQVVEQIVNAIVSVVAASSFVKACSEANDEASYGAMGGTLGTLAGAFSALLLFIALYINGNKQRKDNLVEADEITEDDSVIFKAIILTVIPVAISQSIYQLGYTLDDLLYGNIMAIKNVNVETAESLQGIFNTQYNQMINLPVAIATAMASATLPSVVASYTLKNFDDVKKKINSVLKINLIIAIPSAIGLSVLADPIMAVLFPRLGEYHNVAVMLLRTGSSAVVFYTLSTITTSVLQGCNKMNVPVKHSAISLVIHVLLNGILLRFTNLDVYALLIGNVSFPLIICLLNIRSVKKLLDYKFDVKGAFIKPFISASVMGVVTAIIYYVGTGILNSDGKIVKCVFMIIAIIGAVVSYAFMLILTKAVTKKELKSFPIIKKFVK